MFGKNDDSWHNGFYPYVTTDKQFKYDDLVVGQKYILVECQPVICGGITMYKSVTLLKKWKTKFLFTNPCHVKVEATWNGRVTESTLAWHGGGHLYPWRDIDADRKK